MKEPVGGREKREEFKRKCVFVSEKICMSEKKLLLKRGRQTPPHKFY